MALIDIASEKQLFVDDYLIESMTNTRQIMNPAEKVDGNPVLRPERPWEGTHLTLNHVIFDEKDQIFKMWYSPHTYRAHQANGDIVSEDAHEMPDSGGCLATSVDGIRWERPVLGLVEFQGSTENNLLPAENVMSYFFQDLHEAEPAKRYKGLIRTGEVADPGMKFDLYYSPDAFNWTPFENNPVIDLSPKPGRWGPTAFMGWDPIRVVYAVHMENNQHFRGPLGKRVIGRAESPDMTHWSDAETILVPNEEDAPDTQFYAMPAITYEGFYVGMLWNFRVSNMTHHPQIVFSRNGIHYDRAYREPFITRGGKGEFDSNSIYTRAPIVHGDHIFTYYTGINHRSPESLLALGDKATSAVGLAITPLDGFVSLDGVTGHPPNYNPIPRDVPPYSQMVTRSFSFAGSRLHINVESAPQFNSAGPCEVRVEVLNPNHERLSGYEFEDADPITTSGLAHVASWNGKSDLSAFADRPIKLRFYFKNCKLYSFQFK